MAAREHQDRFAEYIDWNLFKDFYLIGRHGGIGAAARHVNRKQPGMSSALLRLEDHVGVKLCERSTRGTRLTAAGLDLFHICEAIYGLALSAAPPSPRTEALAGSITMRIISNLHLNATIDRFFQEFHARFPGIEIKLDVAPPRSVLHAVQNAEADIGIGFAPPKGEDFDVMPVYNQIQQLYCGRESPLYGIENPPHDAISRESVVLPKDEPDIYTSFRLAHCLGKTIAGIADNLQERIWLVSMGIGIAFLPKPVVDASPFASKLWPLLPEIEAPVAAICIVTHGSNRKSAAAEAFLELARSCTASSARQAEKASFPLPLEQR